MADCQACERNDWGRWRAALGDDDGALSYWRPVLDGTVRCTEEPHRVLGLALLPLLRTGQFDEARGAFLRGYSLARRNINLLRSVGQHIEFCALTGNEARGLEILAEHQAWVADRQVDARKRLEFISGVAVLLRRLTGLGYGSLPVGAAASRTVASLVPALEEEIRELCGRYDARNGNSAVSDLVNARLRREPLVDQLPLGLPSRLPATPVASPASPAPSAASGARLDELIARARELQAGDPQQAESYARDALAHAIGLPPQGAAMLASLRANALSQLPDRAAEFADASLTAAARWDGISEPDTLHNTFNAARAYARLNRHAEAAALFAEAMPKVDVPYDPAGIAQTREAYARSLRALGRHRDAAEQFLEAARLIAGDPDNASAHALVAADAALALQQSGQHGAALAAFQRAAELFGKLGNTVARVRCLRSAAWLQFRTDGDGKRTGVTTMRSVLASLESLSQQDPAAAERDNTVEQLDKMLKIAAEQGAVVD
jgi:tetratricopeptide (TPR) repeat protein